MLLRAPTRSSLGRATPSLSSPALRSLASSSSRLSPPSLTQHPAPLLHNLRALLGRYPLVDEAWNSRLERAVADLTSKRSARVAVIGHHQSGAEGLVTALLDDPLSSSTEVTVALEARRLRPDAPEAIVIKYGEESRASPAVVELPSSWLKNPSAEVIEIVHGDGIPPFESSFSTLHLSDAVVLVLSDSTLLSSPSVQTLLYNLESKPNLYLALNTSDASPSASAPLLRTLHHQLSTTSSSSTPPKIVVISTEQALAALAELSPADPLKSVDYEAFSSGYLTSQLPSLSNSLTESIQSQSFPGVPTPLQTQTASYVLSAALSRAAFSGAEIASSLESASSSLSALTQRASEDALALLTTLGVDPKTGLYKVPHGELASSLSAVEELLLTRLAWYKLPYRVDDLHAEIALVVEKSYLPQLESSLVYASGRAAALSTLLSQRVDTLLSSPLFSLSPHTASLSPSQTLASLYSPTLLNRVAQSALEASSGFTSTALSSAVTHRRNQITAPGGPVDALQRRAQKAVVSSGTLSLASLGGAGASQLLEYADVATNFGWAVLGVTVSAWWLQRGWEKAKKRFRRDVGERVTGGVEEDLGVAARRLVDRSLFKTRTAVSLAEELIRTKQRDFEAFRVELTRIEEARRRAEAVAAEVEKARREKPLE